MGTALGAGMYSIAIYGGLVLFGAFLLYDTQKVIHEAENHPAHYGAPPFDPVNASFTVFLRAACLEKLPRASPEFNLMVLTKDFEGPLVKVRVALQSREAANILDLERLYRSHQVPNSYSPC